MGMLIFFMTAALAAPGTALVVRWVWQAVGVGEMSSRRAWWLTSAILTVGGLATIVPVGMLVGGANGNGDAGLVFGAAGAGLLVTMGLLTRAAVVNRPGRAVTVGLGTAGIGAALLPVAIFNTARAGYWQFEWMLASIAAGATVVIGAWSRIGDRRRLAADARDEGKDAAVRGLRRAEVALAPLVVIPAAAALLVAFVDNLDHDAEKTWVCAGAVGGALVSAALLVRALIGDRSGGRRRCPKCWYDMGVTAGIVCPECGRDAKSEDRLFGTRRRRRFIAASLVPLLVGLAVYGAWFGRDGKWVQALPTPVLLVCSPWLEPTTSMGTELGERIDKSIAKPLPGWERWLAYRALRRSAVTPAETWTQARRQAFQLWILYTVRKLDDDGVAALATLAHHSDPMAAGEAVWLLGQLANISPERAGAVIQTLREVSVSPDPRVQGSVMDGLLMATQHRLAEGLAPALLLTTIAAPSSALVMDRACLALENFDPSDESRRVLYNAASSGPRVPGNVLRALTRHAPSQAKARELLIAYLRNAPWDDRDDSTLLAIVEADRWYVDARGGLSEVRRALYSDDVRAAFVTAATADFARSAQWVRIRAVLAEHPCFTLEERDKVQAGPVDEGRATPK